MYLSWLHKLNKTGRIWRWTLTLRAKIVDIAYPAQSLGSIRWILIIIITINLSSKCGGCEQSRQTTSAAQVAAELPELMSRTDQLDQQPIDVTEYQPTHFRFTESLYRKYLPDDMPNLIGRVDAGVAGMIFNWFHIITGWTVGLTCHPSIKTNFSV